MTRRLTQAGLCSGEEEAHLQVSLAYSALPSTASKPLGRCLTLPLHLHVLPSLQVCTMREFFVVVLYTYCQHSDAAALSATLAAGRGCCVP